MTDDKQNASSDNMTRKQRRAAERAARKKGGGSAAPSSASGSSGPSMLMISIGALVIGVVAVVALIAVSGGLGGDDSSEIKQPTAGSAPAEELRDGRTLVAAAAVDPVVVEAFEDPQCVHCGTFTKRIEPLLVAGPVSDGTASFTYNDFIIFGEESFDAAVAMRAADELDGKFWDYHQVLFENQQGVEDGSFSRDRLADMAELVGLDRAEFLAELDNPELVTAVADDRARAVELGATSTPTIVVNGELIAGSPSWDDLKAAIEAAAAGA